MILSLKLFDISSDTLEISFSAWDHIVYTIKKLKTKVLAMLSLLVELIRTLILRSVLNL